jgi:alpha-L-fucosidase
LFLEWPDGEAAIASLGTNAMPEAMIERVEAIGGGPLEARRDADALRFRLPRPEGDSFVPAVRISGSGLV